MARESWQNSLDYLEACREDMNKARMEYQSAARDHINALKNCTVAEAYELGMIKFNFATEGLPKHVIEQALGLPVICKPLNQER